MIRGMRLRLESLGWTRRDRHDPRSALQPLPVRVRRVLLAAADRRPHARDRGCRGRVGIGWLGGGGGLASVLASMPYTTLLGFFPAAVVSSSVPSCWAVPSPSGIASFYLGGAPDTSTDPPKKGASGVSFSLLCCWRLTRCWGLLQSKQPEPRFFRQAGHVLHGRPEGCKILREKCRRPGFGVTFIASWNFPKTREVGLVFLVEPHGD